MGQKIAVLGAGESGIGAALLAKKKGIEAFVSDSGSIKNKDKEVLSNHEIKWEEGKHSLEKILSADEVVKSPGIPDDNELIVSIKLRGKSVISEVEFAFRYTKAKVLAITGSNGKTTTTLLLGHILKKAGLDVLVAGNVGVGFAKEIAERDYDYIVLELSSFQLDGIQQFRPNVAIVLNITPDHLDRYENDFEKYVASKLRITKNQQKEDVLIYNKDDHKIENSITTKAKKIAITLNNQLDVDGAVYKNNVININLNNNTMTIQELALQGRHNIYNSMAAAIASRILDVKKDTIRQSLLDFQNIEHRLEHVLTVHGIDFINDSKATNVNASWYALESMTKPVIWIVGGVDKGNNYEELQEIVKERVKAIVFLGDSPKKIQRYFKKMVGKIEIASSMEEAVRTAYKLGVKGDAVLLSPTCASFDLFKNFEDRGQAFKNQVRKL
ncbi:MAG: UDP-N-acetylmuramoyl-L-alanine--D-glutamate ligase [Flavobacteriales bacterium TMED123]|nr:MAG: UDP-N-acetylmuramoyl-L-alanine--D-glutamate ligase [Flavobacteriales bacterium TMED123]|tara:strand:+ start:5827 stop:7152 length:1326 start_codon:yes stop_codon:yes gene_type:complete